MVDTCTEEDKDGDRTGVVARGQLAVFKWVGEGIWEMNKKLSTNTICLPPYSFFSFIYYIYFFLL